MLKVLHNPLVKLLTHPYKFHRSPPPYDMEKHFLRLYALRVKYRDEGFFDASILNAKIRYEAGVCNPEEMEASLRKLMNGVAYEETCCK